MQVTERDFFGPGALATQCSIEQLRWSASGGCLRGGLTPCNGLEWIIPLKPWSVTKDKNISRGCQYFWPIHPQNKTYFAGTNYFRLLQAISGMVTYVG